MKFNDAKLALCLLGFVTIAYSQDNGICLDQQGNDKGPSGFQELLDDEGRIRLDRRGGELCGCSFVSHSHVTASINSCICC